MSAITTLQIPDLQGISLHSRIFGTVEPDWETYLELPAFETDSDEVENDDLPEPEAESNLVELEDESLPLISKIEISVESESSPEELS